MENKNSLERIRLCILSDLSVTLNLFFQGVLQNVRFVFGTTLDAILRNKGCQSGGKIFNIFKGANEILDCAPLSLY